MIPRVFLCHDYKSDFWRVERFLQTEAISRQDVTGAFGPLDWSVARQHGELAIRRLVLEALENTQVTLVLIGEKTAGDALVKFEIDRSVERGNGLLGLHIHMFGDEDRKSSLRGDPPAVPEGAVLPVHEWDGDVVKLHREIAAAFARSAHYGAVSRKE